MAFQSFLRHKRIHAEAWQQARPEEYGKLEKMFELIGDVSFDQQKKFLFNPLRLSFPLPADLIPEPVAKPKAAPTATADPQAPAKAPAMKMKLPLKKSPAAEAPSSQVAAKPPALKGKVPLKGKLPIPPAEKTTDEENAKPKPPALKGKVPLKKKPSTEE
ncbi:MAG: hypothetical protein NWR72_07900 [Bacteroidia bacterium]|nr:hypothetical protein [Bacteroidia bacterium]